MDNLHEVLATCLPDLATQFESILSAVWAAERNWNLDSKLALAVAS